MGGATRSNHMFITSTWMHIGDQLGWKTKTVGHLAVYKKNGIATIFKGRDAKPYVSENNTSKTASAMNASNPTYGFNDACTNDLGRLEYLGL